MKVVALLLILGSLRHGIAQDTLTPLKVVKEGVYFQKNGFQTTILELKEGKFRYWFSSDMKMPGDQTRFPLAGAYITNAGEITIVITNTSLQNFTGQTNIHYFVQTNRWTFMSFNGKPTLWRADGLKYWEEKKRVSGYSVLFPTAKSPGEIWDGN